MILHAAEAGSGPPICLLHGLFGRAQNFGAIARTLSATHRVLALDLRNHGASPHAPGMGYATMAADVQETLSSFGALPCAVLGHSMGGKVAMMLALSEPAAVSALLVADIAPIAYLHHNAAVAAAVLSLELKPGLDRRTAAAALESAVPDAAVRSFLLQNLNFQIPAWRIGLPNIAAGIAGIEGWPATPARYEGPTLFIRGARSDYVADEQWPRIQNLFPAAQLATLPNAAHWLHADQPAAFAAIVIDFLASLPPALR